MNANEFGKQLIHEIARRMDDGVDVDEERLRLTKPFDGGMEIMMLTVIPHPGDADVIVNAGVRHDEVEELVDRGSGADLTADEQTAAATIGAELGALQGMVQRRWKIRSEEEIPEVAESIVAAFKEYGSPLLERFVSLPNTLSVLSRDDDDVRTYAPIDLQRAMRAVAAARALGDGERAHEIAAAKRKWFRDTGLPGLDEFDAFLKVLDHDAERRPRQ
jgi:hypothetical protein